jgi:transposase
MTHNVKRIELSMDELRSILQRIRGAILEKDYQCLEQLVNSYLHVLRLAEEKGATIRELRRLLFGSKSEKLRTVLDDLEAEQSGGSGEQAPSQPTVPPENATPQDAVDAADKENDEGSAKEKRKGHGRNGADAYEGAERKWFPHETLKPYDSCPEQRCTGTLYEMEEPIVIVLVTARPPLDATRHEYQRLRCNVCLKIFTPKALENAPQEKYDAKAASMIGLLRYGTGVPHNRLEGLQQSLGIPLPASTQWDIVERAAKKIAPAYAELIREAAQGDVLYNDDTPNRILEVMKENKEKKRSRRSGDG